MIVAVGMALALFSSPALAQSMTVDLGGTAAAPVCFAAAGNCEAINYQGLALARYRKHILKCRAARARPPARHASRLAQLADGVSLL